MTQTHLGGERASFDGCAKPVMFWVGMWPYSRVPIGCSRIILFALAVIISRTYAEYRSFDGRNNNLIHPLWGSAGQPFLRGDGSGRSYGVSYRDSCGIPNETALPTPRQISNLLVALHPEDRSKWPISAIHIWFGQFLDHDITRTPANANDNRDLKIEIPSDDSLFKQGIISRSPNDNGSFYMSFSRSAFTLGARCGGDLVGDGCKRRREQLNIVSSLVDGSQLYGSSESVSRKLRQSGTKCELKVRKTPKGDMLPWNDELDSPIWMDVEIPSRTARQPRVYAAGDLRANENIGLSVMTTLFVREHNRLCGKIRAENPTWDEEKLFQEARRWNIAFLQRISLEEYVPSTTGRPLPQPYSGYKQHVNPTIDNFFATVAFRYGHTEVTTQFARLDDETRREIPSKNISIRDSHFNKINWEADGIEPILIGMSMQRQNDIDPFYIDDLRNHLFYSGPFTGPEIPGLDLAARNILRARDHGILPYNKMREYFSLRPAREFGEIASEIEIREALRKLYTGDVSLVDAYVGALAEDHFDEDRPMGDLFRASIEEQYMRLRDGDRFYYENLEASGFTQEDLSLIRKTRLADIIIRNTNIGKIQCSVFYEPKAGFNCGPKAETGGLGRNRVELLGGAYKFNWTINSSSNILHGEITANTKGWVGIGFTTEQSGSMLGADALVFWVDDHSGQVGGFDAKITSRQVGCPGVCRDEHLGGQNNILSMSGSQNSVDGVTFIRFSRALHTGDSLDVDVVPGMMEMVFAYGVGDELAYHGENKMVASVMLVSDE